MNDARILELIEQAFEYRGYVTISRRDGTNVIGFVYDRTPASVEMFDEHALRRIRVGTEEITDVALTGDDSAAAAQRRWERRKGSLESRHTSAWGDWGQRPILIVVALKSDLRGVARVLGAEIRGSAVRRRIGDAVAVARLIGVGGGASHVLAGEQPRLVISCGFSGALDPTLRTGDLVLASSVHDETGDSLVASDAVLRVTRRALEGVGRVSEGEILCASRVATTSQEKQALARPGRLAVDLESWAVARAAERANIPWLALRVVLDPLDMELPAFTKQVRSSYVSAALRHALRGPRAALQLARLGARADTATRSLERALRHLVPVLGGIGLAQEHA
jgi:adenosylhomocysteine nucleosidase